MASFLFGGETGISAEDLARQKAVAEALLARGRGVPRDAGEGLAAIGNALAYRMALSKLGKGETARREASQGIFDGLFGGGGSPASASGIPMSDAAAEVAATSPTSGQPIDMTGNEVYSNFIDTVKGGGLTNPYGLAAVAATGKAESGWSPENVNRRWSDPSESGQAGTAGAILSWRGDRLRNLENFASSRGEDPSNISPQTQAAFFLQEDPDLIGKLNNAKSVEEAQGLMNNAWRFAGYNRPGGEAANRLSYASSYLPAFQDQGGAEVASLDPAVGMAEGAIVPGADPIVPMEGEVLPEQQTIGGQTPAVAAIDAQMTAMPLTGQAAETDGIMQAVNGADTGGAFGLNPMQQEVAQAIMSRQSGGNGTPSLDALLRAAADPRLTDEHRKVVGALLEREMAKEQAERERLAKQADPEYRLGLEKQQLEVDALRNPRASAADQLAREKFEWEKQNAENWNRMSDGRLFNKMTGEIKEVPGGSDPVVDFDDVSGVRKEIHQLPSYKNMAQALPIYRSMAETAGRNSKASDLNLVYGLGKIMDPTSVVREGEMVMVKNTSSLPDWLQGAIASLNGGAALTPETRQAIMTEAYGRVQGYDEAFKQDASMYTGIAERNRINLADVLPSFGEYEPWVFKPEGGADPEVDDLLKQYGGR